MLSISVSEEAFGKTPSQHTNRRLLHGAILGLRRLKGRRLISGTPPAYPWLFAAIFVSYVVGDCIAIPFRHLLARESMA